MRHLVAVQPPHKVEHEGAHDDHTGHQHLDEVHETNLVRQRIACGPGQSRPGQSENFGVLSQSRPGQSENFEVLSDPALTLSSMGEWGVLSRADDCQSKPFPVLSDPASN
eukprot:9476217-Pyramimonas_sp.AAC.1